MPPETIMPMVSSVEVGMGVDVGLSVFGLSVDGLSVVGLSVESSVGFLVGT